MTIEGAALFFVCSILYGFGIIILSCVTLIINNLFSKYWKSLNLLKFSEYPPVQQK